VPRYFFAFLCSLLILFTASRAFLENWKCGQVKAVTMDILTVQLNLKAPLTIHGLGSSLFVLLARHVCSVTWIFTIKLLGLVWLINRPQCFCIQCMDLLYFIFGYLTTMKLHREIFNFLHFGVT